MVLVPMQSHLIPTAAQEVGRPRMGPGAQGITAFNEGMQPYVTHELVCYSQTCCQSEIQAVT